LRFKRIILKLSGEALSGDKGFGIDDSVLSEVAKQVKSLIDSKVEVAIVIGGGNFWRGRTSENMDRSTADYMGMLATVINSLAFQSAIENLGISTRVMTAIEMDRVAEPYIRRKAVAHLSKGRVVIFAAGTGNPFFSTDTTAALRAAEINADAILFAKNIDAVYDKDPNIYKDAIKYDNMTYKEILDKELKVMDLTAAAMLNDNNIPIIVFGMKDPQNIIRVINGEKIGTSIRR
jgi:uridylate kinase